MAQKTRNPALARRAPQGDLSGEAITSESSLPLIDLQAQFVARRCPISMTAARVVAELCFSTGRAA
jgi:hypothetical protein